MYTFVGSTIVPIAVKGTIDEFFMMAEVACKNADQVNMLEAECMQNVRCLRIMNS